MLTETGTRHRRRRHPVLWLLLLAALLMGTALATAIAPGAGKADSVRADDDTAPPAPSGVTAVDGNTPGVVVLAWNAVPDAAYYRIGWVSSDRIAAGLAAGRDWQDAFAFADVANLGQTAHTLPDLAPGARYAFIIGSLDRRFGAARWSEWAYLTLAEAPATSCPTATGQPTPTSTPMPTPTPTPSPAPPPAPMPTPAPPTPTPSPTSTRAPTPTPTPTPQPAPAGTGNYDYDADQDGLIEVSNLTQLAAIRADLNGDGVSPAPAYAAAFPNAMPGMGCPAAGCAGYELIANLDFDTNGNGEADAGDAYWNDGAGWLPIGDFAHKFTANFDGNNHTIANLYINRQNGEYVGLFGYARAGGINRVGLASATVSGAENVGGLVGAGHDNRISDNYATGSVAGYYVVGGLAGSCYECTINDSYAASSVSSSSSSVGGLVGSCFGCTIGESYAAGSVSGGDHNVHNYDVGGLVGSGGYAHISGSYATGSVSGSTYVGGLVGRGHNGSISDSYATGGVSGGNYDVGGLVGNISNGSVIGSYATGSVSGGSYNVGGLVGGGHDNRISASYAMGSVTGNDSVGGLVGDGHRNRISASYAAGSVVGKGDDIGGLVGRSEGGAITASYAVGRVSTSGDTFYIGGLIGYHEGGDITASYWDTQTTGQAGSYGGIGKTTAELQSPAGYTGVYAEWNLDLDDDDNADDSWDFGNSTQYPVLQYGGLYAAAQRE